MKIKLSCSYTNSKVRNLAWSEQSPEIKGLKSMTKSSRVLLWVSTTQSMFKQLSCHRSAEVSSIIRLGKIKVKGLVEICIRGPSTLNMTMMIPKNTSRKLRSSRSIQQDPTFSILQFSMNPCHQTTAKNVCRSTSALKWNPLGTRFKEPQTGNTQLVLTSNAWILGKPPLERISVKDFTVRMSSDLWQVQTV